MSAPSELTDFIKMDKSNGLSIMRSVNIRTLLTGT